MAQLKCLKFPQHQKVVLTHSSFLLHCKCKCSVIWSTTRPNWIQWFKCVKTIIRKDSIIPKRNDSEWSECQTEPSRGWSLSDTWALLIVSYQNMTQLIKTGRFITVKSHKKLLTGSEAADRISQFRASAKSLPDDKQAATTTPVSQVQLQVTPSFSGHLLLLRALW